MKPSRTDTLYMRQALAQARLAAKRAEVPVGAVLVRDGRIVARGRNEIVGRHDPSAHAELLAIRAAAKKLGNERLTGCVLYSTLEPCPMCAGAMVLARIARLVYGARDPRAGATGSRLDLSRLPGLNHRFAVTGGVLARPSARLLREFFRLRR
jgi:tRNA(adenine34) deaminase